MGKTIELSRNFDQGFISDESRADLGKSAAYRMRDYIPQLDAPLMKRGGYTYGSPDLGTLGGTPAKVSSIGYLPFAGDGQVVAIEPFGKVYQLKRFDGLGGTLITNTGTADLNPSQAVFWHKTGTTAMGVMLAGFTQTARSPNKYIDTGGLVYQVQSLGGTPPQARMGFSWGDYLVLGNYFDPSAGGALKNFRWAFSGVGNPESWTYSGVNSSTFDFPEEMLAGYPLRNAIMAFGYENCYLLTGDTPPPGGNLARSLLYGGNGTFDPKSVAGWRDSVIWANSSGVFQSDGATLTDLTYVGGISNYYRNVVAGFNLTSGFVAAGGIYFDHYILSISNAVGVPISTLVCDLSRRVWTEWTNIDSSCFARRASGPGTTLFSGDEELFFAHSSQPRVGKISSLWMPSAGTAWDADGSAVLPSLETPYYTMDNVGLKRIRNMYLRYDMRTAVSTVPILTVSSTFDPGPSPTYTPLSPTLTQTTQMERRPVGVRSKELGVAFKIMQNQTSALTGLYGIEAEGHSREPSA